MVQHGLRLHNGYQTRRLVGRGPLVGFTSLVPVSVSPGPAMSPTQFFSNRCPKVLLCLFTQRRYPQRPPRYFKTTSTSLENYRRNSLPHTVSSSNSECGNTVYQTRRLVGRGPLVGFTSLASVSASALTHPRRSTASRSGKDDTQVEAANSGKSARESRGQRLPMIFISDFEKICIHQSSAIHRSPPKEPRHFFVFRPSTSRSFPTDEPRASTRPCYPVHLGWQRGRTRLPPAT